ncbi:MAG: DinB family protein [Chloroflexi bacterium]|nr:DinB family protein [Chloroflexota bacterium]
MTVTLRAFIAEGLEAAWKDLRTVTQDLTQEQLLWHAAPEANSIGYLLWHVGRVEDNFIQRFLLRGDEVWTGRGWQERFGYQTRGIGTGFTPGETEQVPIPSLELVWGYLDDVREHTLRYLSALDWSTLPEKPRAERFPQWSIQTILRQLSAHANQHLGEINYLRGLMGLPGALG